MDAESVLRSLLGDLEVPISLWTSALTMEDSLAITHAGVWREGSSAQQGLETEQLATKMTRTPVTSDSWTSAQV